ncbi:MAG: IS66 family transposase [Clostridiaceae bacterium]|nr:IS66 family transposase [Clostridiaceae bacterium]
MNQAVSAEQLLIENSELQDKIALLESEKAELLAKLYWFEENYRLQQQKLYGRSSEKTPIPDQQTLFNEAELLDAVTPVVPEPTVEEITYKRKKKQKGHREEMLKDLPVEIIEHKLPEEEQICDICGNKLHEMSMEITRELEIIPPQVKVIEHRRSVYSCDDCEKNEITTPVITAPMPKRTLPGSIASAATIAHVMTQKYMFGVTLYRQETYWKQLDIEISRQTMANWLILASNRWLSIIFERMHQLLLQQDIIHADETGLQVLHEPGRAANSESFMWLYRTGREGHPIALFEYQTTRARKHPQKFLQGFKGYLCTDGYQSYEGLPEIINVACLAHARRKWDEALKSLPKEVRDKPCAAKDGLAFCNRLYSVEHEFEDATPEERYEGRLLKSKPILDEFYKWLKQQRPRITPKSTTGKAVTYCLNQWDKLNNYLLDGRLYCDNNISERSIKGFVISRKNFLFCNTPNGATASAMIYSIIETSKANSLKPFDYMTYLLKTLPNVDVNDLNVLDSLMPWSQSLPQSCRLNDKSLYQK